MIKHVHTLRIMIKSYISDYINGETCELCFVIKTYAIYAIITIVLLKICMSILYIKKNRIL